MPLEPLMMPLNADVVKKNEVCMSFTEGLCTKGNTCPFAHNLREFGGQYKPRLCPSFIKTGNCLKKGICMYAHSKEELPPSFKCIMCQNFSSGTCRKSNICQFAHGEEELSWFINFMGVPATTPSTSLAAASAAVASAKAATASFFGGKFPMPANAGMTGPGMTSPGMTGPGMMPGMRPMAKAATLAQLMPGKAAALALLGKIQGANQTMPPSRPFSVPALPGLPGLQGGIQGGPLQGGPLRPGPVGTPQIPGMVGSPQIPGPVTPVGLMAKTMPPVSPMGP